MDLVRLMGRSQVSSGELGRFPAGQLGWGYFSSLIFIYLGRVDFGLGLLLLVRVVSGIGGYPCDRSFAVPLLALTPIVKMNPLSPLQPDTELEPESLALVDSALGVDAKAVAPWLRRLWGGSLVVVGYLLSPLCWWNDLVINLPLALGFGYLASRPFPDTLVPMTGLGYWLTNVVGFVLMQQGAVTALQKEGQGTGSHSLRNGLITSTLYTLAIVVLLQLHILDVPDFLTGDLLTNLNAVLPGWLMTWISA